MLARRSPKHLLRRLRIPRTWPSNDWSCPTEMAINATHFIRCKLDIENMERLELRSAIGFRTSLVKWTRSRLSVRCGPPIAIMAPRHNFIPGDTKMMAISRRSGPGSTMALDRSTTPAAIHIDWEPRVLEQARWSLLGSCARRGSPSNRSQESLDYSAPERPFSPEARGIGIDLMRDLHAMRNESYPQDSALAARIASYELAFRMQHSVPEVMDFSQETAETQAILDYICLTVAI